MSFKRLDQEWLCIDMQVISHRGLWTTPDQRNTLNALQRSLECGFGVETDVRDADGELVIAHDMANRNSPRLADFLKQYRQSDSDLTLALNIKADGLQRALKHLLEEYAVSHYFVFDMSIPDTLGYLHENMITFTRQSEYESTPAFAEQRAGTWIDCFESDWPGESLIRDTLKDGKQVCLVSPELHGRTQEGFWAALREMSCAKDQRLMLCTDFPTAARSYFSDQD